MNAELARGRQGRLLRLAGDERVVALVRGLDETRAAAARDHRDALDPPGPLREDDRSAPGRRLEPPRQLVDRDGLGEARAEADLREDAVRLSAEALREQRVVPDLG